MSEQIVVEHDFSELHVDMALQEQLRINSENVSRANSVKKNVHSSGGTAS